MHHSKAKDIILGLIILIFTWWMPWGATASMWIVTIAAAIIVIHGLVCSCYGKEMSKSRRR